MWYFYVLQSQKDPNYFYKGSTNDLKKRFSKHQAGKVVSTKPFLPCKLIYYEAYINEEAVRLRESRVKMSGSVSVALIKRIKDSLK